jgi:hypothetical protein
VSDETPKTAAAEVRVLYARYKRSWKPYWDAMGQERDFLDGDRYADDEGKYNRDRRLTQVRGQETFDTIRHITAKVTERPRSITSRPIDQQSDAALGEVMASLCERELADPWKDYDGLEEKAIISARTSRLGIVWADWDPDCGALGEIIFRNIDGRRCMWDPAYEDNPHHPHCGWFIEDKCIDVDEAKRLYPKAKWLVPDRDMEIVKQVPPGTNLMTFGDIPPAGFRDDDNKVTLRFCWYKNDPTVGQDAEPGSQAPVDPEERYMACGQVDASGAISMGCGYRSPTQGDLRAEGGLDNPTTPEVETALPQVLPQGCPICGGDLHRIDAKREDEYRLAYEKGKRLVITSPFCPGPEDEAVYDDKWPIPRCRSFPVEVITAYSDPGRILGPSDVSNLWDMQFASDSLRTVALQRTFEYRTYFIMPAVGITNHKGKRFRFRDDDYNVMFRDMTKSEFGPLNVEKLDGTGLDPSWPITFNANYSALTQYRGITDFGPNSESLNQQSGAALQERAAVSEVPLEHFRRRLNRERSKFVGVLSDMIAATLTPARAARLNIDGLDIVTKMHGDDMPNYDFVLEDSPPFTGVQKEKSDAVDALIAAFTNPATMPFVDIIAKAKGFPPSIVREVEKRMNEMKAQAPPPGAPGVQGSGPPNPAAGTANGAPMNGNGAGMVPAVQ